MGGREHPYASFLNEVNKPAQYIGGEQGQVRKDWDAVECRICLAFPDLYEIGMSHLGYKILYGIINKHDKLLAERAYAVWHDMEHELRERGEPLRSQESWRPLSDFDIVGFSLQYELTYTNILQMLDLGGVPRWSTSRGEDDPLVIAGGPTATHGEPVAPFIDVFLIGDGEEKTPELMLTWSALKHAGMPRDARLREIAKLGGFYVPALYDTEIEPDTGCHVVAEPQDPELPFPIERSIIPNLEKHPFPTHGPVAAVETIFDRVSVEIARGCTEGCRFCQAGMIYRPVRERSPQQIIDTILESVRVGGYDEASLTSLSTADYSAIGPLVHEVMNALDGQHISLGVSSLRAYGLEPAVLDDMTRQRAGGLTFAPEAGSQRMRDVVNKNVTDAQLMETAERVFSRGWTKMKLYFMIGLPTEEDEDVRDIVRTGARALDVARRVQGSKRARVTVSVSTHVPKPHTPFQWCAMDSHDDVLRKQDVLKTEASATRVKLRMHNSEGSWLEGVLARGDRRLAPVISGAFDRGARFDSWDEKLELDAWRAAFAAEQLDPEPFLGTIPVSARLPWSHIDVGLADGFLAREYRRALRNRLSPPCGKVAGAFVHPSNVQDARAQRRPLVCYDCGVACDLTQMKEERLVALRSLGAHGPHFSESPAIHVDRRPMRGVDQGKRLRVRLGFTKLGPIAFSSHLDLVRVFPRMLRRLDLPLFYSEGFRPKPLMTFSPALALGTPSLTEYVDVTLCGDEIDSTILDTLKDQLNEVALEGIEFFAAQPLESRDPRLGRIIDEADYVAAVSNGELRELGFGDAQSLTDVVNQRLRRTTLTIHRQRKGVEKQMEIRRSIRGVRPGKGYDALAAAGIVGSLTPIEFTIIFGPDGTPRPHEVLASILEVDGLHTRAVRTGLFTRLAQGRCAPTELSMIRGRDPAHEPSRAAQ